MKRHRKDRGYIPVDDYGITWDKPGRQTVAFTEAEKPFFKWFYTLPLTWSIHLLTMFIGDEGE